MFSLLEFIGQASYHYPKRAQFEVIWQIARHCQKLQQVDKLALIARGTRSFQSSRLSDRCMFDINCLEENGFSTAEPESGSAGTSFCASLNQMKKQFHQLSSSEFLYLSLEGGTLTTDEAHLQLMRHKLKSVSFLAQRGITGSLEEAHVSTEHSAVDNCKSLKLKRSASYHKSKVCRFEGCKESIISGRNWSRHLRLVHMFDDKRIREWKQLLKNRWNFVGTLPKRHSATNRKNIIGGKQLDKLMSVIP